MIKLKLKKRAFAFIFLILGLFLFMLAGLFIFLKSPVDKNDNKNINFEIEQGTTTVGIANELKEEGLIRSEFIFKLMIKFSTNKTLKASVYELNKGMSTQDIIDVLTEGNSYNPDMIRITFNEGESVKKYALKIANNTNNKYEDIMAKLSNQQYIDTLISKYWFLTDEIKDPSIYIPLEGYLSPNTYEFKNRDVTIEEIFEVMLNQMGKELKKYRKSIESSDWSVHKYLTMASMLELEGTNHKNRSMIAGVFFNRLEKGMNLGSDVTTYYAFQEEMNKDLTSKQFNTSNPYNTRASNMGGKLPVGPICNPSIESIDASINRTNSDYLFFVADKHGKIHYTRTDKEHMSKVAEIKKKGDWIW